MTIIKENISFYSTLKFKLLVFSFSFIVLFYVLCFFITSSAVEAGKQETIRALTPKATLKEKTAGFNPLDINFLKELSVRQESLKLSLDKNYSGRLFMTKSEIEDMLNNNKTLTNWQKYTEYRLDTDSIIMDIFYPVSEISLLKYLPGISTRSCIFKIKLQPAIKNNVLYLAIKSISLPNWSSPLRLNNVLWAVKFNENEWQFLKKFKMLENGVFMEFEKKIESGR